MEGQVWLTPDLVPSLQTPVLSVGIPPGNVWLKCDDSGAPLQTHLVKLLSHGLWNLYSEHVCDPHQCASRNHTLGNYPRPSNEDGELTALFIELEMIYRD